MRPRLVGVLGGMGPLATVDFMQKVIWATPARRDQDHVPMIVHSVPQIPDRTSAIINGGDDPFPALLSGLRKLERCGAKLIVVPCNTAHAWYDRLAAESDVPLLHIAMAVRQTLDKLSIVPRRIGLMGGQALTGLAFYQQFLQRDLVIPKDGIQEHILAAITAVKSGDIEASRLHAEVAATTLLQQGADRLLLACTELPIALAGSGHLSHCVDATDCLAKACVEFSLGKTIYPAG